MVISTTMENFYTKRSWYDPNRWTSCTQFDQWHMPLVEHVKPWFDKYFNNLVNFILFSLNCIVIQSFETIFRQIFHSCKLRNSRKWRQLCNECIQHVLYRRGYSITVLPVVKMDCNYYYAPLLVSHFEFKLLTIILESLEMATTIVTVFSSI